MTGPVPTDAELLARLGALARAVDPVPAHVQQLGRATFGLRRLDDELAELVADSDVELAGVRGARSEVRLLSFAAETLLVEVQVTGRDVLVQVVAGEGELPAGGTAELGGTVRELDTLGGAGFTAAPGPVRVAVQLPGAGRVTTSWFHV